LTNECSRSIINLQLKNKRSQTYVLKVWEDSVMAYGKITDKQREILEYIKNEILNRGFPPAVREICEAVNLKSTSSVHAHLESLEKNGYIRRDPTKPRAIEIVDDNFNLVRREMVNVPVLGRVAAGEPLLAIENVESYFPIPAEFMPNAQTFILNVVGESMINAGILDGDKVIVEQTADAQNGDIVVALVDDSATVKRFYKEKDCYRLQPENDYMDPIIVHDQLQTHIPKICSDFLQNHIDKRMFEIYNKFTVKEQTFANICFESMGGIYYDDRIQRKDNCYTKHSQKCTPRKMSYQKNKMQTFPFCQYVFDLSGNSCRTPFYQRRCKCRCTGTL
jgi:repressor LexA